MKTRILIVILLLNSVCWGQTDINRLSELQKIYFIAETNSLTTNFVNPAALSINKNDDGFLFAYDFLETKNQGTSLVSLSMGNLGFIYQDVYSIDNMRLTSYALNISVGGDLFSFGTSNKIINVAYIDGEKSHFTIDAGLIIQPSSIFSIGLLANNINNVEIDSFQYQQIYSVGARITIVYNLLDVFAQTDFKDSKELDANVVTSAGFSLKPLPFLELRTWLMGTKDFIDEGILSAVFNLDNGFIISASTHFNDQQERTRYNAMLAIPLQTISF